MSLTSGTATTYSDGTCPQRILMRWEWKPLSQTYTASGTSIGTPLTFTSIGNKDEMNKNMETWMKKSITEEVSKQVDKMAADFFKQLEEKLTSIFEERMMMLLEAIASIDGVTDKEDVPLETPSANEVLDKVERAFERPDTTEDASKEPTSKTYETIDDILADFAQEED